MLKRKRYFSCLACFARKRVQIASSVPQMLCYHQHMSAEDTLAVCMLIVLLVAAGTVMTILFSMMRNAGKKDELAELLKEEETAPEPEGEPAGPDEEPSQPWEKQADWWRE